MGAVADFLSDDVIALVILVAAFITRWLLADFNSYWLDELYSVSIYGVWNDSALDAVSNLANSSVHPPLYQFILYNWMDWLGDSETATRTLSNVYVTLAGLFLYLLTRDAFSRLMAVLTTALFSVMYFTMFFGLEVRSYAQTIFLAALSSYLLLRIMGAGAKRGWRSALVSPTSGLLTLANAALLLTHYYNIFFLAAQALCAAAFVIIQFPIRRWIAGLASVAAMYLVPGALFAAIWGRVFATTYLRRADEYAIDGTEDLIGPIELLRDSVFRDNLSAPRAVLFAGAALVAVMLWRATPRIAGDRSLDDERRGALTTWYLAVWLILPAVVAYVAFSVLGVARFSDRYFLFSTIPLAPIIALAIAEACRLGRSFSERLRRVPFVGLVGVTGAIVFATAILPGTHAAATADKADWRGIAQSIVGVVESDPDSSHTLYETSFRTTPVLDYYLARSGGSVRVDGTIRRAEERRGENYAFERASDVIEDHDFLIVAFTHHSVGHFPIALEVLESRYEVHHRHLDSGGRGYIVFRTDSDQGQ